MIVLQRCAEAVPTLHPPSVSFTGDVTAKDISHSTNVSFPGPGLTYELSPFSEPNAHPEGIRKPFLGFS